MNPISTPEPSLSSRAMLCSLSLSMWSARKHDPEAEEGVEHPFRDSVVTRLVKLIDVLPKLNVTADPRRPPLQPQLLTSHRHSGS